MRHFLQLLAEKFMKMPRHGSLLEKLKVLAKSMVFRVFSRNEALFATFSWKVDRNAMTWWFVRKVAMFWPNRWFIVLFHEMRHFLQLFPEKLIEMQRHGILFQKLLCFGQIDGLSCFFTKSASFCNFFLKSSSKCKVMVVCSKKLHSFGQIDYFSCFSMEWDTFCNFLLKSSWKCQDMVVCSKSWKSWQNRCFIVLFHEMRHFLQLFPEKLIEMQWHGSLFEKLHSFCQIDEFSCFSTKCDSFCNFSLKSSSKRQKMVVRVGG